MEANSKTIFTGKRTRFRPNFDRRRMSARLVAGFASGSRAEISRVACQSLPRFVPLLSDYIGETHGTLCTRALTIGYRPLAVSAHNSFSFWREAEFSCLATRLGHPRAPFAIWLADLFLSARRVRLARNAVYRRVAEFACSSKILPPPSNNIVALLVSSGRINGLCANNCYHWE